MPDILTMSDEEFLANIDNLPGTTPAASVTPDPVDPVTPADPADPVDPPADPVDPVDPPDVPADPPTDPADPPTDPAPPVATDEIDYKAAYERLVGREFKVGNKTIKANTVEEVEKLAQMGAGFHQNSQKLAKHRRFIATLEEAGLLEESKINELIDISKNNPEAIAALVQRAGLEPHQLIPQGDAQPYTPGQHVLPDDQLRFRTSVDNIREQGGEEFLTHVAQDWDVASRAEVYKDPTALDLIYSHKQTGIYDKISSEVERRKVFDPSLANKPFIHSYLAVGNEMHEKGLLVTQPEPTPTVPAPVVPTTPAPVAVKPAVASQPVTPNPAAARAASVRSTPATANGTPNFLTMSDAEFLKHHKV